MNAIKVKLFVFQAKESICFAVIEADGALWQEKCGLFKG